MNDLDTVLRDALDARVAAVAHDPDAYGEILRRRARRRATRWVRPIGAAAATAAVVGLVAVVVRAPAGDPPVPAAGLPRYAVTVRDVSSGADRGAPEAAVVDADNLAGPPVARMTAPPDAVTLRGIAAVGDDRTFYAAWRTKADCRSGLYRLTAPSGDVTRVLDIDGDVTGLAVSPDGRRLAYAMRADGPGAAGCGGRKELRVRDLASGRERVWAATDDRSFRGNAIVGLVWSPDGRYVAYAVGHEEVRRIDTTAAPVAIPGLPPDPFITNLTEDGLPQQPGSTCYTASPEYLPTGELVAAYRCVDHRTLANEQARLVVFDPVTRRPGRTLFTYPAHMEPAWLTLDATGTRALLWVSDLDSGAYHFYRWSAGTEPRPVTGDEVTKAAVW